jgi:hypothetical protein
MNFVHTQYVLSNFDCDQYVKLVLTIASMTKYIGGQMDVNFSQSLHRFTLVYSW